jgi:hypothetical protein
MVRPSSPTVMFSSPRKLGQPCASKKQRPRVATEDEEDKNARELLTKLGFDTDNLNKKHDGVGKNHETNKNGMTGLILSFVGGLQ